MQAHSTEPNYSGDDLADQVACAIPEQMLLARRWLLWKQEPPAQTGAKPRKVPYYVNGNRRSGTLDSAEDQFALSHFTEASNAFKRGGYTGLGFALGPDGCGGYWQGVDLDEFSKRPQLRSLVDDLPGYTEDSPSGDGRHAIGYGRDFPSLGSNSSGVEAYSKGRFFTVTGERAGVGTVGCLADYVETSLQPLHSVGCSRAALSPLVPGKLAEVFSAAQVKEVGAETAADLRSALAALRADDRTLWVAMGHALKEIGPQGRALFMEWSQTSEKYDPLDAARTWDSFRPETTNHKAVFAEAQRQGWVNPRSNVAQLVPTGAQASGSAFRRFRVLTADEVRQLPSLRWLVRGVLPDTGVAAIYGPSGSGKSFLVLDMAAAIAGGRPWFGHKVRQTGVVYVCLEGEGGLRQRIDAWVKHHRASMPELFRAVVEPFSLSEQCDVAGLAAVVRDAVGPGAVVILDTLNRAASGKDENSSKDMSEIITQAKRLQALTEGLVLVVHHTGKDEARGMRGHSSLLAALDASVEVKRDGLRRTWAVKKSKEGKDDFGEAFMLEPVDLPPDSDGEPVSSCVVARLNVTIDYSALGLAQGTHQVRALEALRAVMQEGQPIPVSAAIEAVAGTIKGATKRPRERAREALEGLVNRGALTLDGEMVRLYSETRISPNS